MKTFVVSILLSTMIPLTSDASVYMHDFRPKEGLTCKLLTQKGLKELKAKAARIQPISKESAIIYPKKPDFNTNTMGVYVVAKTHPECFMLSVDVMIDFLKRFAAVTRVD